MLLTLLFVLELAMLGLIFIYLMSFVGLVFHERRVFEALSFGPQTFFHVVYGVPLLLVLLVALVFIVLHLLVRHFAFAYMRPVMATLSLGLVLTLCMFLVISSIDPNRRLAHFGEGRFSGVILLHKEFRPPVPPEIIRGTIQDIKPNGYIVQDISSHIIDIRVDSQTRFHETAYDKGDRVMVFVHHQGDMLYALGIRKDDVRSQK